MTAHFEPSKLARSLIERLEALVTKTDRAESLVNLLGKESTNAFVPYLESSVEKCELLDVILREGNGDESVGEFRHRSRAGWGMVIQDASEAGKWRLQTFDECGFSGHQVYRERLEALEAMVDQGYTTKDSGRLDQLAETKKWKEGMEILEMISRVNAGSMSYGEFHAKRATMG